MTIHFPDVSNYQAGLSLQGAVACIAKATEGTTFKDKSYTRFRDQALAMGIPFAAYHWLHTSNIEAQARNAFSVVGPNIPLMIDDEDVEDGLDVRRTLAFVTAYRALGGTVTLEYLPQWFWRNNGHPDIKPLVEAGLSIVSSDYSQPYSDTGPGWREYTYRDDKGVLQHSGVWPTIWQYTSTKPWNGYACDFNAFKGTVEELRALFHGKPVQQKETDMPGLGQIKGDEKIWLIQPGEVPVHVPNEDKWKMIQRMWPGIQVVEVTQDDLDWWTKIARTLVPSGEVPEHSHAATVNVTNVIHQSVDEG